MNTGEPRGPAATVLRPDGIAFQLLRYLAEEGCSPENDVAKSLLGQPASIAKAFRELEQAGLIKRRYVALTPAGLAAMEKVERRAANRQAIVDKAAELAAAAGKAP